MLFKNLFIENATEAVDIRVTDGKFEKIAATSLPFPAKRSLIAAASWRCPPLSSPMSTWIPASPPAVPAGT